MRHVVLTMFMSLDGYIAGPGGEFTPPAWSAEMQQQWSDVNLAAAGTLLYGRVSYAANAAFWQSRETDPEASDDERAFARSFNQLPKIVFSTTLKSAGWNTRVVSHDVADQVRALKEQPGKDLILLSGARIAQTFMALDLIDRYRLLITPVLLGGGIRLFEGDYARTRLTLTDLSRVDTGAVIATYHRHDAAGG